MIVEGHPNAQNGDKINQEPSERRAAAVREYTLSITDIQVHGITATGYGEGRPVANNETTEGGTKNRHIDVMMQPQFIAEAPVSPEPAT